VRRQFSPVKTVKPVARLRKSHNCAVCSLGRIDGFTEERRRPETGSVPDLLCMFEDELRFYREVAPEVAGPLRAIDGATGDETVDNDEIDLEAALEVGQRDNGRPLRSDTLALAQPPHT
jgi:hypothetical protein